MGREVRRVPPPDHPQDKEATWFQAWETVTEGTPVTPPFATTDELVDYLVTRGDFWDQERGDGPWDRKSAEEFVTRDTDTVSYAHCLGEASFALGDFA